MSTPEDVGGERGERTLWHASWLHMRRERGGPPLEVDSITRPDFVNQF